jgi:hypothetical protein
MTTCKVCDDSLVLEVEAEDDDLEEATTVPDDLALPCGCHFHW